MIAWYLHHHGAGHLTRFLSVRPLVQGDVLVLSSMPAPDSLPPRTRWRQIERDDEGSSVVDPTASGRVHWAPLRHPGLSRRMGQIAAALVDEQVRALVVDVSVEVAVFGRLLGTPVVLMDQPGDRSDPPHRLARAMASAVIAPWPSWAHVARDGAARAEVGGISRHVGRDLPDPVPGSVLGIAGGSDDGTWDILRAAERATPGWSWRIIGGPAEWCRDPWPLIARAEVVVAAPGQNLVADLAAASARAVVVPRPRPFDEQHATAAVLARAGLAVVADDPPPAGWPGLLDAARRLSPPWHLWEVEGAAERAARVIDGVASS